jgi:hypothetical protein
VGVPGSRFSVLGSLLGSVSNDLTKTHAATPPRGSADNARVVFDGNITPRNSRPTVAAVGSEATTSNVPV